MRIAIPIDKDEGLSSKIVNHFGRCLSFLIVDENTNILDVLPNDSIHNKGTMLPPEFLKKHQVEIVLCQSLGPKALQNCKELDIHVYLDPSSNTSLEILQKYLNKQLQEADMDQTCKEHHK